MDFLLKLIFKYLESTWPKDKICSYCGVSGELKVVSVCNGGGMALLMVAVVVVDVRM